MTQVLMTPVLGDLLVSAQQAAHERLREMIFSGELQAGQALRQEEIARQLGVSRLPIREALNRLATEGLVELKPRRGFYVASLDVDEIEDIFDMRALLEARAGYLATENRTAEDADAIDALVASIEGTVAAPIDFDHYAQLNLRFHERFYQSCGRKHLRRQISLLRNAVAPLIRILASEDGELSRAQDEHRQLSTSFRSGDADRVATLCKEHCAYTARALIGKLRSNGLASHAASQGKPRKSNSNQM
jgi:DNA-binding GntR family transcriptional regulator